MSSAITTKHPAQNTPSATFTFFRSGLIVFSPLGDFDVPVEPLNAEAEKTYQHERANDFCQDLHTPTTSLLSAPAALFLGIPTIPTPWRGCQQGCGHKIHRALEPAHRRHARSVHMANLIALLSAVVLRAVMPAAMPHRVVAATKPRISRVHLRHASVIQGARVESPQVFFTIIGAAVFAWVLDHARLTQQLVHTCQNTSAANGAAARIRAVATWVMSTTCQNS